MLARIIDEFEREKYGRATVGLQKAKVLFGKLDGYCGAGLSINHYNTENVIFSISMRFTKMPEGLDSFPVCIDIEGFDVPLDVYFDFHASG